MAKLSIKAGNNDIPISLVYNQNGGGTIQFWKGTDLEFLALTSTQLNELDSNNTVFFILETQ